MSTFIQINSITGTPPFELYVSDYYGSHEEYLDTINETVPPIKNYEIFSGFTNVPLIKLRIVDGEGCESNQNIVCT